MTPIQAFGLAIVIVPTVLLLVCYFCIWHQSPKGDAAKTRKLADDTVNKRFIKGLVERTREKCSVRALEGYYDCKIDLREDVTLTDAENRMFVNTLLDMRYRVSDYGNGSYTVHW